MKIDIRIKEHKPHDDRYVRLNDVRKAIDKTLYEYCLDKTPILALSQVLARIDAIRPADVRENRQARWKCSAIGIWYCSLCNEEPYYAWDIHKYKYCPFCGAIMDGGDDE